MDIELPSIEIPISSATNARRQKKTPEVWFFEYCLRLWTVVDVSNPSEEKKKKKKQED